MKKTMKSFLALAVCAVAMVFVSCSNDDVVKPNDGDSEFLFKATYEVYFGKDEPTLETVKAHEEIVHNAVTSVGFTKDEAYSLSITGKDSASVSKVLLNKMKQVEARIAESSYEVIAQIRVNRLEYRTFKAEDGKRPYYTEWYNKLVGTPSNKKTDPEVVGRYGDKNEYRFVKRMETEFESDVIGDYRVQVGMDMNKGTWGKYISLLMVHSGKASLTENKFAWESQCEGQYITDVIAVYSDWIANPIYVNGRAYYKEQGVCDLNKTASGRYIYLYACRQKFAESDGKYYYLNTGGDNPRYFYGSIAIPDPGIENPGHGCRAYSGYDYDLNKYLYKPYTAEGHKFVERVLPLYDTDKNGKGTYVGDIDLNRGAGGPTIRMVLSYATKEGGY